MVRARVLRGTRLTSHLDRIFTRHLPHGVCLRHSIHRLFHKVDVILRYARLIDDLRLFGIVIQHRLIALIVHNLAYQMRAVSHAVVGDRRSVCRELYRRKGVVALSDRRLHGVTLIPGRRISARQHTRALIDLDPRFGAQSQLFRVHIHRRDAHAPADLRKIAVARVRHRAFELLIAVIA